MRPLATALRTLTILPLPGRDSRRLQRALPFFPVVGALLALIPTGVWWLAEKIGVLDMSVPAVIAVALLTLTTGALHLDGLGDVADAFGAGGSRERILEILKDSHMGTFGITAIVLDVLLKTALWRSAFETGAIEVVAASLVLSRTVQALLPTFMPSARPNGTGAPFTAQKGSVMRSAVAGAAVIFSLLCVAAVGPLRGAMILVGAGGVALLAARWFHARIGGITGDCLGASGEATELIVLALGLFPI